jgi:hypothetical protein
LQHDFPRLFAPEIELSRHQIRLRSAMLDVIFGVALSLLALAFWIGADYVEGGSHGLMGSTGFPRGVSLLLGTTTLLMAIRGALQLRAGSNVELVTIDQPLAILANIILVIAYPILISTFGYYVATGPWLVLLLFASGNRKPLAMIAYATGFLVFTKLIFEILIGVPLP